MSGQVDELMRLQARVLETIARGSPLPDCLDELCDLVQGLVPGAICSVMLLDRESGALRVASALGACGELVRSLDGLQPSEQAGSCGTAAHTGKPVYVEDTLEDARWAPFRAVAQQFGIRSCWSYPVVSRDGGVLGTFAISRGEVARPEDFHLRVLGTASHLAGIAIDRRDQDERLLASELRYQQLFEGAPDLFARLDPDGVVLMGNRSFARALGTTEAELVGRRLAELCDGPSGDVLGRLLARLDAEDDVSYDDLRLVRADGTTLDASLRLTVLRDGDGGVQECFAALRDVTARKRAEDAVREAQKLESLGVLASGIAHDFNNLLVGVLGNAQLALDDLPSGSSARRLVESIEAASMRAGHLTRELLAYAGHGRVESRPLSLRALSEQLLAILPCSKRAEFALTVIGGEPWIRGDEAQLQQVLLNLFTNAAEASEGLDAPVEVRTGVRALEEDELAGFVSGERLTPGEYSFLEVRDRGVGMDEETAQRIFEPFFTTKSKGRGLGLAATLGIIKGHGGGLRVESAPGEGSHFRIVLPVEEPASAEPPPPAAPEPAALAGLRLLVVDDEDHVLDVLEGILSRAGSKVLRARSGREAVEVVRRDPTVDAVVLDVTMPGMSGTAAYEEIRRLRPDLPVAFCSGHGAEELAALVGEDAATRVLPKPFTREALGATLRGLGRG